MGRLIIVVLTIVVIIIIIVISARCYQYNELGNIHPHMKDVVQLIVDYKEINGSYPYTLDDLGEMDLSWTKNEYFVIYVYNSEDVPPKLYVRTRNRLGPALIYYFEKMPDNKGPGWDRYPDGMMPEFPLVFPEVKDTEKEPPVP